MQAESTRARSMAETRKRIVDVALEVMGQNPDAGMEDVAASAGVVRRTVYGHFPTRTELVRTLAQRAVDELAAVLAEIDAAGESAAASWVDFVARLWPLTRRYRVILALRRSEYGADIHALLGPVDEMLAELVRRGQDAGEFGKHLPADVLSQIAYAAVFTIADGSRPDGALDARAATITSLLLLGVPESRAQALVKGRS